MASLTIALASPSIASSIDDALQKIHRLMTAAAGRGARIVCFPEAYLPGLRGLDFDVPTFSASDYERCIDTVSQWSRDLSIATILGTEKSAEEGRQIVAVVINGQGQVEGYQTKNQLDPSEDPNYVPGDTRQLFTIDDVPFGIAICHEGWRYPETVRWAAMRGARIVFHPQLTGSDHTGEVPVAWGAAGNAYYEKAMMMRSRENTIYFASVNYALRFPESATSIIGPSGECEAFLPYGEEGVLVHAIDPDKATGLLARRYAPERYR